MADTYWNELEQSPARLFTSLALLMADPVVVPSNAVQQPVEQVHDLSDVEVDDSGLDFLTEYRAGLEEEEEPEPIPDVFEVPDPMPGGVVSEPEPEPGAENWDNYTDEFEDPQSSETLDVDASEYAAEYGQEGTDFEAAEQESFEPAPDLPPPPPVNEPEGQQPEPQIIYVRDYHPHDPRGGYPQPEGNAGGAPAPYYPGPAGYPAPAARGEAGAGAPVNPAEPQTPQAQRPELAPLPLPNSEQAADEENPQRPGLPNAPGYSDPLVMPSDGGVAQQNINVGEAHMDVSADQVNIPSVENFDPSRYLDFDDQPDPSAEGDGDNAADGEESESKRTRRVLADFGAGKRITQTENPAQAMQVLRELTVFRD